MPGVGGLVMALVVLVAIDTEGEKKKRKRKKTYWVGWHQYVEAGGVVVVDIEAGGVLCQQ